MKHKLSVGAIFRNESHSIDEWIQHYLAHGAEHFYLINDDSTDNSVEIIQPYVDSGIVTLYNAEWGRYLGRQRDMYTHYILPHLNDKECQWLLMVDLDEYMWSPLTENLFELLEQCHNLGQIQVGDTLFGSNGHIEQPERIVASFTRRAARPRKCYKYFVNSDYKFTHLNVHHATFVDKDDEINNFIILSDEYFILNHYSCQSRNFWRDVKCTRNDGDNYRVRTMADFDELDVNDVEDLRLGKPRFPLKPV
jgi:hypothetical protein